MVSRIWTKRILFFSCWFIGLCLNLLTPEVGTLLGILFPIIGCGLWIFALLNTCFGADLIDYNTKVEKADKK